MGDWACPADKSARCDASHPQHVPVLPQGAPAGPALRRSEEELFADLDLHLRDPPGQVVSTKFQFLDGRELNTHQYSVTQYERDCASVTHYLCFEDSLDGVADAAGVGCRMRAVSTQKPVETQGGHQTMHGYAGVPG